MYQEKLQIFQINKFPYAKRNYCNNVKKGVLNFNRNYRLICDFI